MLSIPTSQIQIYPSPPANNKRRPFLTPLPGLPGEFLLVQDNTTLDKIKRCPVSGRNYAILGREPHARNAALVFGGAIHEGLELFHTHQFNQQQENLGSCKLDVPCSPEFQDQAIVSYFTNNPLPSEVYSSDHRTQANALEVLRHYRRRSDILLHPDYEWEILSDSFGPIIERAFEVPMAVLEMELPLQIVKDNPPEYDYPLTDSFWIADKPQQVRIHLAWSGRIDLVASVNGIPRVVDHKTSSIDGEKFTQGFELASQTIGYVWASRQPSMWPEMNLSHFCANAIYLKKPTSDKGLLERGPRGGEPALRFDRHYYEYSDEKIESWKNDTIATIEDFLHSLSRSHFPKNDRSCFDKYGRCPYWDCCTLGERVGMNLLQSEQYKDVVWNPTT